MNQSWRENNPFGQLNPYELRHLVADLEERGPHEKLHRVFLLEDAAGHNAWYEAKSSAGAGAEYTADMARAWAVLKQQNKKRIVAGQSADIATELRYALATGLRNADVTRLAGFAVAFVKHGLWSPSEAVSYALHDTSWHRSLVTLAALCRNLEGDPQLAAQQAVLSLIAEGPPPDKTSVNIRRTTGEWSNTEYAIAADCLLAVIPTLAEPLLDTAAKAVDKLSAIPYFHAMRALLVRLPAEQKDAKAQSLWKTAEGSLNFWKAEKLAIVAPLMPLARRAVCIDEAINLSVDVLADDQGRRYRLQTPITPEILVGAHPMLILLEDLRALKQIAPHLSEPGVRNALARATGLPDEMRAAAESVLLPCLVKFGAGVEALANLEALKPLFLRCYGLAALMQQGFVDPAALTRTLAEVDALELQSDRALGRAFLAQFVPPSLRLTQIASVLTDLQNEKDNHLIITAVATLAAAFQATPIVERVPLVESALELCSKATVSNWATKEFLSCDFVPHLDGAFIHRRFRAESETEIGVTEQTFAAQMRQATSVSPIPTSVPKPSANPLSVARLVESLQTTPDLLAEADRSRSIILAAQFATAAELTALAGLASKIENPFARSFALCGLIQTLHGEPRYQLCVQLLETLATLTGGLNGAAPFFQTISTDLLTRPLETYEIVSTLAGRLAKTPVKGSCELLTPMAPVLQMLAGPEFIEDAAGAVALLNRWWGKRDETPAPAETPAPQRLRFEWRALPDTDQGIAQELLQILADQRAFDAAEGFLAEITTASTRDPSWQATAQAAFNSLLSQCSAAGDMPRCKRLFQQADHLAPETALDLARALIKNRQLDNALHLVLTTPSRETAWAMGYQVLSSLAAEDRAADTCSLFVKLTARPVPVPSTRYFVDSCFLTGNTLFKANDRALWDNFLATLQQIQLPPSVYPTVSDSLSNYANKLNAQGYTGRAEFWRNLTQAISQNKTPLAATPPKIPQRPRGNRRP